MPNKIFVTETILRDAHQSLLATRMRTEDMLPICGKLDRIGYWSLEVWGGATFDAYIRFLKEDPWERLRKLRAALPNSRLQMLLRGQNLVGYRHYSDDVVKAFIRRSALNGIDVFRIFDAMNDVRNLRVAIEATKSVDKHAQGTIAYTTSPVHTTDMFVAQAKEMQDMGCDSIAIKDMAGLLTPFITGDLVKSLKKELTVPLFIHVHDTAGLASMCQIMAINNGITHIDTAISSFAWGTSHPATESMVASLKGTDYDTGLDLSLLREVGDYFSEIRKKYKEFESPFTAVDTQVQINQVPGGMISNLANQLKEQNSLDRMQEVLAEIPKVRKDLGYPPLVTPTSQIIGTQAFINVITGERYKSITEEVKRYLKGAYGRAPGKFNEKLLSQVTGKDIANHSHLADNSSNEMDRLTKEIGDFSSSEEDTLLYAMFPDIGKKFLKERSNGALIPQTSLKYQEKKPLINDKKKESSEKLPTEFIVGVHGESYQVEITGIGIKSGEQKHFYLSIDGVPEEVVVQPLTKDIEDSVKIGSKSTKIKGIRAPMVGNIIDILVNKGDLLEEGQPVFITEAMKMETEVFSTVSGKVSLIHVAKGQHINSNDLLLEVED